MNGHSKAFIYWTESLKEASIFLGRLIPFSDLDLSSLEPEATQALKESYETSGLNQVAVYCFRERNIQQEINK